jgi:hypothetical protein
MVIKHLQQLFLSRSAGMHSWACQLIAERIPKRWHLLTSTPALTSSTSYNNSLITGARSLNEQDLSINLECFKDSQASIESIRSKLALKILDEYSNILKDMFSTRFNGPPSHVGQSWELLLVLLTLHDKVCVFGNLLHSHVGILFGLPADRLSGGRSRHPLMYY